MVFGFCANLGWIITKLKMVNILFIYLNASMISTMNENFPTVLQASVRKMVKLPLITADIEERRTKKTEEN